MRGRRGGFARGWIGECGCECGCECVLESWVDEWRAALNPCGNGLWGARKE
jgi:hypothetical protein